MRPSRGFAAFRARASDLESNVPYGCMHRLLGPAVSGASARDRDPFEDAAAHASLLFARGDRVQARPAADGGFATLHGLYWLLNNLTRERPMVLCIDDLQWADPETVRFLGYLAPRLDGLPLAVVASVRPQSNVTADMARLLAAPEAITLRPGPLSVEATAVLCERELGAAVAQDFAAACHGATGGNPFFLQTLLREARELRYLTDASQAAQVRRIGPAAVARAVLLRLATAPAAVTALVRAISVLGDAASVLEAARLADLDDDAAARAADLLVELAILRRAEGLEFAHPIVAERDLRAHRFARARAHARPCRPTAVRTGRHRRTNRRPDHEVGTERRAVAHRTTASSRGSRARARRPRRRGDLAHACACRVSTAGRCDRNCCWSWAQRNCDSECRRPWTIFGTPSPACSNRHCWRLPLVSSPMPTAWPGTATRRSSALESAIATVETHDRERGTHPRGRARSEITAGGRHARARRRPRGWRNGGAWTAARLASAWCWRASRSRRRERVNPNVRRCDASSAGSPEAAGSISSPTSSARSTRW